MNQPAGADFETMLRLALHPVDPPDRLKTRVETTLQELTDAAVDELEAWEIGAMRDPRNWVRPVVAAGVGTAATAALVVLRVRAQQRSKATRNPLVLAERVAGEARRALRR